MCLFWCTIDATRRRSFRGTTLLNGLCLSDAIICDEFQTSWSRPIVFACSQNITPLPFVCFTSWHRYGCHEIRSAMGTVLSTFIHGYLFVCDSKVYYGFHSRCGCSVRGGCTSVTEWLVPSPSTVSLVRGACMSSCLG